VRSPGPAGSPRQGFDRELQPDPIPDRAASLLLGLLGARQRDERAEHDGELGGHGEPVPADDAEQVPDYPALDGE
jgi:hypothetical protein